MADAAGGAGLVRRLGTADAVLIGLGSMIGAGVFSAFAPAAAAAGAGLLIGLGAAAVVAYCNATASAQLAATYPVSGGTYVYGRERLGPWWGFLAGWGFVVGKTASCALLALLTGVGRTTLAMARGGDLPRWLGAVHPTHEVPHHAEIAVAAVVSVLVLTTDLRGAIGFSSFGVLVYYLVANLAAGTQPPDQRRYPRWLQVLGAAGCAVLAATLPWTSVLAGLGVFAVGACYRGWLPQRS